MASQRAHVYVDYMMFGRSYRKIHREMDRPFRRLGRRHRIMLHDPVSAIRIAQRLYPGDPVAVRAALLHITIDKICSRDPEFKKTLEAAAILWSKKKRRRRRF